LGVGSKAPEHGGKAVRSDDCAIPAQNLAGGMPCASFS
jgi:hypothetical protein